ncbi:MAG: RDD family protein [Clostridia bacterium]|nr:RDD family protein [Clostridia bacterium]
MKAEVQGKTIEIEPNSKPYLLKRIIADGFDTVLIFGLFMLFTALIMRSPAANVYNGHYERYAAIEEETKAAYGSDAAAITEALNGNREYLDERFSAELHGYLLKVSAGLLATFPVLLATPFLNRNRATPGKLMTGIMPFHERRQRRAVWYQIFFRFLFVFLIDCMGLYLLTGIWTFVLVPVLRLIEILCSRKDKTILDMMTGVLIIEKLSYNGIN